MTCKIKVGPVGLRYANILDHQSGTSLSIKTNVTHETSELVIKKFWIKVKFRQVKALCINSLTLIEVRHNSLTKILIKQVCVLSWNTYEVSAFEMNFSNSLITHVSNSQQNCWI